MGYGSWDLFLPDLPSYMFSPALFTVWRGVSMMSCVKPFGTRCGFCRLTRTHDILFAPYEAPIEVHDLKLKVLSLRAAPAEGGL